MRDVAAVTLRDAGPAARQQVLDPPDEALEAVAGRVAGPGGAGAEGGGARRHGVGERDRRAGPARRRGARPGRTGTSVRALWVAPDLGGLEREGAVAALAVRGHEPGVEVLDRRLRVERDEGVLEGVRPDPADDVGRDEAERVAHGELAAPDLGLQLLDREAALRGSGRAGSRGGPGG